MRAEAVEVKVTTGVAVRHASFDRSRRRPSRREEMNRAVDDQLEAKAVTASLQVEERRPALWIVGTRSASVEVQPDDGFGRRARNGKPSDPGPARKRCWTLTLGEQQGCEEEVATARAVQPCARRRGCSRSYRGTNIVKVPRCLKRPATSAAASPTPQ